MQRFLFVRLPAAVAGSSWFVLAALAAMLPADLRAQGLEEAPPARVAVYAEAGGNARTYSLNLDYRLSERSAVRAGVSVLDGVAVPLMANFLIGEEQHFLEIGLGAVVLSTTDLARDFGVAEGEDVVLSHVVGTGTLGYRYQRPEGGLVFRAGLTPSLSFSIGPKLAFGASLGYSF